MRHSTTCLPLLSLARPLARPQRCCSGADPRVTDPSNQCSAERVTPAAAPWRLPRLAQSGRARVVANCWSGFQSIALNTTSAIRLARRVIALTGSCSTNCATFVGRSVRSASGWESRRVTRTLGALARFGWLAGVALVLVALLPGTAHAWTPGTHVYLGEAVLRSLWQLPDPIADLLRAFPYNFLYGSIAADTSMAKKYVPTGRHCHSWIVGLEIHDAAPDEPMRAFALGYLAHLAADAIAHNYFVPKQLAITASTSSLGHTYWESRFETHLGTTCARQARDLIMLDHSQADGLLDRILSPTIFSTQTNRRIFRGMVHAADNEGWQRIFGLMTENSRWDLTDADVSRYLDHAYDHVVDFLVRFDHSTPYQLDPSGDEALRLSKQVRREALRMGGTERMHEEADRHFGLPALSLGYVSKLVPPLYGVSRVASN